MAIDRGTIQNDVYDAIASLAWANLGSFDDKSDYTKPPLSLTSAGVGAMPVIFSRISASYGGKPVRPSDITALASSTVGACVDLVFRKANTP